jgi:hypothetical protein
MLEGKQHGAEGSAQRLPNPDSDLQRSRRHAMQAATDAVDVPAMHTVVSGLAQLKEHLRSSCSPRVQLEGAAKGAGPGLLTRLFKHLHARCTLANV